MKKFKKWTGEERQTSLNLTNKAKKMGLIPQPRQCCVCGQTEGILQLHNTDYDVTLQIVPKMIAGTATEVESAKVFKVLKPVCWRCHMVYHSYYRNRDAVKKYFKEVREGTMYPPVYKHDFKILEEHGIF